MIRLLVVCICALSLARGGDLPTEKLRKKAEFWTFQKAVKPKVPKIAGREFPNPIDAFVAEKWASEGLHGSPEADRRTLARRVYFDLTGLPPTPEEFRAFMEDRSPNAYERLVDRLLASPRYGERWARYWLDIVHFGESHGYDKDKPRPNAWPYRDYVIQAANEDMPYSRFVQEQLAGDILFPDDPRATIATGFIAAGPWDFVGHAELPESKTDGLIARYNDRDDMVMTTMTTFESLTVHCARCHDHKFDPITQEDYYRLQAVFAGVDRADRMVEPDVLTATKRRDLTARKIELALELRKLEAKREAAAPTVEAKRLDTLGYHSEIEKSPDKEKWVQLDFPEPLQIDAIGLVPAFEIFGGHPGPGFGFPVRFKVEVGDGDRLETIRDETKTDFANPGNAVVIAEAGRRATRVRITATKLWKRTDDYAFALGEAWVISGGTNIASTANLSALDSIEASPSWSKKNLTDGIGVASHPEKWREWKKFKGAATDDLKLARNRLAEAESQLSALPAGQLVYAAATDFKDNGSFHHTGGKPRVVNLLKRGDVKQPVREMEPGALGCLPELEAKFDIDAANEGERRAALAKWLTRDQNFLLRRSIVNRVWQFHFGRGIVDSPNDFGHMGSVPTHPELLEWLAFWFKENGESIKALHKLIVMSAAYRQSSADQPDLAKLDGDNRFLWRMNRARLDAEQLHDAMLQVSCQLDLRMGGPSDQQFFFKDDHSPIYDYTRFDFDSPAARRRSIYRFIVRSVPDPLMEALDCPDASLLTGKRTVTLTALQALATLNNPFVLKQVEQFAKRLQTERPTLDAQTRPRLHPRFESRADGIREIAPRPIRPRQRPPKRLPRHFQPE
jgi:hypothetical protein